MAVPKRKMSRSNTRARRSQWKASAPTLVACPNRACGEMKLPHTACANCGQYDGKQVLGSDPDRRLQIPVPVTREPADQGGLSDALGVEVDPALLRRALTHRSYAYEHGGLPHNERLEFLGDAVLGIVVTDALYRNHPDLSEGRLAKLRASVVNMRALAAVARGIGPGGLGAYVRLGRGEESTGGRDKASILADTLEAVFGAIYLDGGIATAGRVIHELFDGPLVEVAAAGAGLDWKTSLQELTAEHGLGVPEYVMSAEGPDHAKVFTAQALVAGELFAASTGHSKKEAEQLAAETAWRAISARATATAGD